MKVARCCSKSFDCQKDQLGFLTEGSICAHRRKHHNIDLQYSPAAHFTASVHSVSQASKAAAQSLTFEHYSTAV